MEIKKAERKKVKLKLNLSGSSGSGKTMSAILMAQGLTGDLSNVVIIDTENESASLYDDIGDYSTLSLSPPFSPERYCDAIDLCINNKFECIIIDSVSHEWSGTGGCIDFNEKIAHSKFKGNTWSAWSVTTPRHDSFINKILQSNIHIITCTRSKTETVMGEDKKVKKIGMKDIQREGFEYELTISLNIDRDTHLASASKDRTGLFEQRDPFLITPEIGEEILNWCNSGKEIPSAEKSETETEIKLKACKTLEELSSVYLMLSKEEKITHSELKDKLKVELLEKTKTPILK